MPCHEYIHDMHSYHRSNTVAKTTFASPVHTSIMHCTFNAHGVVILVGERVDSQGSTFHSRTPVQHYSQQQPLPSIPNSLLPLASCCCGGSVERSYLPAMPPHTVQAVAQHQQPALIPSQLLVQPAQSVPIGSRSPAALQLEAITRLKAQPCQHSDPSHRGYRSHKSLHASNMHLSVALRRSPWHGSRAGRQPLCRCSCRRCTA